MRKESDISIVMGSGNQGLRWAYNNHLRCFALDKKPVGVLGFAAKRYIRGDSFHLPFKDNSVSKIYSDFLLNAIEAGDYKASDINENPDILLNEPYPQIVSDWYNNDINRRFDQNKLHLKKVGWLLREATLLEMWRVLSLGGKLTITDHKHVVKWVINRSPQILSSARHKPLMYKSEFCFSDYSRSNSLNKVIKDGARPKKVILKKRLSVEKQRNW